MEWVLLSKCKICQKAKCDEKNMGLYWKKKFLSISLSIQPLKRNVSKILISRSYYKSTGTNHFVIQWFVADCTVEGYFFTTGHGNFKNILNSNFPIKVNLFNKIIFSNFDKINVIIISGIYVINYRKI